MSAAAGAGIHVALLRGINVGGKNVLPMKDLAAMFAASGCREVRTFIQSGNVLFRASEALARRVPKLVAAAIREERGLDVPVLTRTAREMDDVVRRNPFARLAADPRTLHVAFLLEAPSRGAVADLDPERSPPDEFVVRGREIYLRCPGGMGRSKLTAQYFDSRLETTSTARNWNTVLKLRDLARGASGA